MSTQTLVAQGITPTGSDTDAPLWTLGVQVTAAEAGTITALWWYVPTGTTGTIGWRVYANHIGETPRTLLGSGTLAGYVADNSWQRFAITPIALGAADKVAVCFYTSAAGRYAYKTGQFPISNPPLSATGGTFALAADAAPGSSSALYFMIDMELTYGAGFTQAIGTATETDTAVALGRRTVRLLGAAAETNTAITLGQVSRRAIGTATEVDTATALGGGTPDEDLDITVGRPRSAWTVGKPRSAWTFGKPR